MDRTTIENAALELFHKRGFDAVKVQDICAACGITKPTFYHYVPSKDDILLRCYDDIVEIVEAHVAGTDPEGPVVQLLGAYLALIDECERIGADLLSRIACSNLQENRGSYDTRPAITERMEAIIATGQHTGVIRNEVDRTRSTSRPPTSTRACSSCGASGAATLTGAPRCARACRPILQVKA